MGDNPSYDYHYNREERLSMQGAPRRRETPKGFLKGNKGLMIVLADIVIIAIVAIIYRQFLFSPSHEAELQGYELALRGFAFQDRVAVELLVEAPGPEADQAGPGAPGRVFATFRAGGQEIRLSEPLPATGGSAVLEGALLGVDGPRELIATVEIGGQSVRLTRDLPRD